MKGGLSSLADDMYFDRLSSKIGREMDFDMPKKYNQYDYTMSGGRDVDDDRPSIMGVEDQVSIKIKTACLGLHPNIFNL